jgi:hypothetical protein
MRENMAGPGGKEGPVAAAPTQGLILLLEGGSKEHVPFEM